MEMEGDDTAMELWANGQDKLAEAIYRRRNRDFFNCPSNPLGPRQDMNSFPESGARNPAWGRLQGFPKMGQSQDFVASQILLESFSDPDGFYFKKDESGGSSARCGVLEAISKDCPSIAERHVEATILWPREAGRAPISSFSRSSGNSTESSRRAAGWRHPRRPSSSTGVRARRAETAKSVPGKNAR